MDEDLEEFLAALILLGLGAGFAYAITKLLLSSADAWSSSSQAFVLQSNNTAVLELATCARCVNQILLPIEPRRTVKTRQSEAYLSTEEQYAKLSAGGPVVT